LSYYESAFIKVFSVKSYTLLKMSRPTPTIYDVAAAARVSISTVSRVLNRPETVNDETRLAVMAAINALGFIPKAEARARALKDYRRIGILTPNFYAPSFVQRMRGAASELQSTNFELVIYTVDSTFNLNAYLESLPLTGHLEGLIILSLQFDDRYALRLVEYNLETVLVEYPHKILSSVEIDDIDGGRMAAEYLLRKGHRRLGFAGDTDVAEFGIHPITLRMNGYRQFLSQAGCPLEDDQILYTPYDMEITRQKARVFLNSPDRPTAIFAATDLQAIGIMKAAHDLGLRIPQDLAVMGFDDLDVAGYMGLTTIRQQLDESGRVAVDLLLARLADTSRSIQHIQLPLTIVERETV
jgi:DNA-binding LacI/PurR family transcriptional regulator